MLRLKHTLNGYMTLFKKKKWGLKSRISGNPFLRGTMAINKKKEFGHASWSSCINISPIKARVCLEAYATFKELVRSVQECIYMV